MCTAARKSWLKLFPSLSDDSLFSLFKCNLNGEIQVPKHNAFGDDGSCWRHLNVLAVLTWDLWKDLCPAGAAAASQTGCSEHLK